VNENENNTLLCDAASLGHTDEVARLVQLCDARWRDNAALRAAAKNGHTRCVELLIPHSSAQDNESWALRSAASYGHYECVKLLMGVSHPDDFPMILGAAAQAGCRKSVALVLQHVSNVESITEALETAVIHKHYDCVDILYPRADVGAALDRLLNDFYSARYEHCWRPVRDRYNAEQQNTVLREAVHDARPSSRTAKI